MLLQPGMLDEFIPSGNVDLECLECLQNLFPALKGCIPDLINLFLKRVPFFINLDNSSHDDFRLGIPRQAQKSIQGIRGKIIVTVQKIDERPSGLRQSRIACGGQAPVNRVGNDADVHAPGVVCLHLLDDGQGRIRGSIINQDDLNILQGLPQHGIQALLHIPFHLVNRDDD